MTAEVIDGRKIAKALKAEVALEVDQLNAEGIACALAAVAVGAAGLIRSEHIRAGAVVLDVGINRAVDPTTGATRMVGDVNFSDAASRARAITPVPGGIGPVTDVWLIRNALTAARDLALIPPHPASQHHSGQDVR
jgi:5,10-methylene-tetrahydrofolate dehydrogenase/methenyl tetrahydrofolate cyclohydrolase